MQTYLNNTTWGRQANIFFTVTRGTDFPANFDLNRNRELKSSLVANDEYRAIVAKGKTVGAFNLYYVGMRVEPDDPAMPDRRAAAFAIFPEDVAFFGERGLFENTAAHEIGHLLGRVSPLHSSEVDDDVYKRDLMYYKGDSLVNQCRIRRPDWQQVQ